MYRTFIIILQKLRLLEKLNMVVTITKNQHQFKIPIIAGTGIDFLNEQEAWFDYIIDKIKDINDATFIDIGTNVGQTLLKVKSKYPNAQYIGFEPSADCVSYVNKLIKLNNLFNSEIYPVGIGNETKITKLYSYSSDTDQAATIIEDFEFRPQSKVNRITNVPLFDISALKLSLKDSVFIKIDVEGSELEVIKSLANIIEEKNPIIICEILPCYTTDNTYRIERQESISNIISDANYTITQINLNGKLNIIKSFPINSNIELTNYLFIPNKKVNEILKYTND